MIEKLRSQGQTLKFLVFYVSEKQRVSSKTNNLMKVTSSKVEASHKGLFHSQTILSLYQRPS